MKKFLVYSAVCLFSLFSSCDEKKIAASEVPQPVMAAFSAKYQGASDVKWEMEKKDNKTIYEVDFQLNGKKLEAEFDADGVFIEEESQ